MVLVDIQGFTTLSFLISFFLFFFSMCGHLIAWEIVSGLQHMILLLQHFDLNIISIL